MHRVTNRTWLTRVLVLLLLAGMIFFLWEYVTQARIWVSFPGSPHIYSNGNIGTGTVTDRSGEQLLSISDKRAYSTVEATRKSTLHWLGDRKGYISAPAITAYASEMVGFDLVGGVYDASGQGGKAELTISSLVQNVALDAMGGRKGTIGVYNYKTGEILCAVTTPTFDPDNAPDILADETGRYDGVYVNRFLRSAYPPGSIFKLVTICAALETVPGIENETFRCYGKLEYGTEAVTCETAHGTQTLKQALANSCNCAFAQIAELVGKKNMVSRVEKYDITEPISFDGVTTVKGNYNIEDTAPVSFAWSCIGQHSDLINPARFMTFVGTIAAGGQGVEPYIVSRVMSGEETTYEASAHKTDRIMSTETAETVKEYMRNNVQSVYGDWNFPGLNVCAKSGTSELGGDERPNAMFTGFVDDERYPLAFIVVVPTAGYGSHTCVPIISRVLEACKQVIDGE